MPAIVTGLLRCHGRGLLVHRSPARRWYPDRWDLPGGHVEDGEPAGQALRRELLEELGVAVVVAGPADRYFSGPTFRMAMWIIDEWEGEPVNLEPAEHDAMAWMTYRQTTALDLAHPGLDPLLRAALTE